MKREKTKHKGIYKVGDTYYVTFYVGSRKVEKAMGPKLSVALEEKKEWEKRVRSGKCEVIERQEKTTFDELVSLYQKEREQKEYILQFIPAYLEYFGNCKLSKIGQEDIFKFRDQVKATPKKNGGGEVTDAHVNRALAGLRRLFNFAVLRKYMEQSPFPKTPKSGLFYSEAKGLRNFFTEKQMNEIIEASPKWLQPLILTAFYTGLRESELLGLRWEWIDLNEGVIYLPSSKTLKDPTGRGQRIAMQGELIDLFKSLSKNKSEWVFCRADGLPFTKNQVYEPFKRTLRDLGIDTKKYSWKEIRHTTASIMNLKGSPPMAIRDQLRHTSVKTTEGFYIGSDIEFQRAQAEKLILNSGKIVGKEGDATSDQLPTA
jgi:integrase